MSKIDHYIHAATRQNTRRSYQSAIHHFEVTWGGFLPATANSVARYLTDYADTLSINTLKQRLAALAQWHMDQGFPDPTKAPVIKKVLKGIKELHPVQEKQAKPLQLEALAQLERWMDQTLSVAHEQDDQKAILALLRNKALVLTGFWRGFRSDELSRLRIENIQVTPNQGMTIYLPRSKGDRQNQGQTFKAPALSRLCPVTAYQDWLAATFLSEGPVFRRIDRWGKLADQALNPNSITTLLRKLFRDAGLVDFNCYSSHSLRRGFATWANTNQWDIKALMEYVGWKDIHSAMRYIESADTFAKYRIESALQSRASE
ncbi:Tn3 family resolvase [Zooshikella ganghwensis]|uniref:Tn3 family resolvase n=2 Tax=Zooshikella ganghwensis TaxID=202772 RepID=A0A4P9VJD7_9GAMM|nr:Tn3 family resolvase [Zooshikella ganghwensis]